MNIDGRSNHPNTIPKAGEQSHIIKGPGIGMTNGLGGRTNGITNGLGGRTNGMTNGLGGKTNGLTNGMGGRTNGMTNGLGGKTNGLTNGMGGRTNGMTNGITNGLGGKTNGLTNGMGGRTNGMTNGLESGPFQRRRRLDERAISPSRISLVLIIAFIIMVPATFFLFAYNEPGADGIRIDGKFDDWNDAVIFGDSNAYPTANLDITEMSVETNSAGNVFLYARVQSGWFSLSEADSLFAFIDSDGNSVTGYSVRGMGAEYAVEVWGWDNAIKGKQMGVFDGSDQQNWSAWNWRGVTAAISGDMMEIGMSGTSITLGDSHSILFMTKRGSAVAEVCDAAISLGRGSIAVRQQSLVQNGIAIADNIMSLAVTAQGSAVDITGITFNSNVGTPTVSGIPVQVAPGQTVTLQVNLALAGMTDGALMDVSVSGVTSSGRASIIGNGLTAYAKSAPGGIHIDGAFGDWNIVSKASDIGGDAGDPNIDIRQNAAVNGTTNAYFYLKTDDAGNMMGGTIVPSARMWNAPVEPVEPVEPIEPVEPVEPTPPTPLKKVSGEDLTRIYIDTKSGGQNIDGISADYLIELKGRNGRVISKALYTLPARTFVANIAAASHGTELEAGVPLASIGFTGNLSYFIESTDWRGNGDRTDVASTVIVAGTRSSEPKPIPMVALDFSKVPKLTKSVSIDGNWDNADWTDGTYNAEIYTGTNFNMYVYHDGTNLYLGLKVSADLNANVLDYCALYFDYGNDKTNGVPDDNDRKFLATDTTATGTTDTAYDGSGGDWSTVITSGFDADASDDITLGYIIYEFKIPLSEVFSSTTTGSTAGFAVQIHNEGGTDYYWGEADGETIAINPLNLSTWGTLEIPEFPIIILPILAIFGLVIISRKRRHLHG